MSLAARRWEALFPRIPAFLGCILLVLLVACAQPPANPVIRTADPTLALPTASPTRAKIATATKMAAAPIPTITPTEPPPDFWKKLPVIPDKISERTRAIYQRGLAMGQDPHIFSRIGDCASAYPYFLVGFDRNYNLGEYTSLQPAIDFYKGTFERPSLAAKAGLNTASLLTTLWTDKQCLKNESLLDCQLRLDHPSFALIAIGTNEAYYIHTKPESFEFNMRIILDDTIARGIIPVLATKADDEEGDDSINATIARLAAEYELPLWNFWLAVQPLPDHGLFSPEHLSTASYANFFDFSNPKSLQYGVQMRNLTALQMLDFLRLQLAGDLAGSLMPTSTSNR
jgi:hypothetical protein